MEYLRLREGVAIPMESIQRLADSTKEYWRLELRMQRQLTAP